MYLPGIIILVISTSWNIKIVRLRQLSKRLGLIDIPYLLYLYYPFLLTKRRTLMMVKQPASSISSCSHASVHHLPHLPLCNLPPFLGHPQIFASTLALWTPFYKVTREGSTFRQKHIGRSPRLNRKQKLRNSYLK